jgi:hypothetical protein
MLIGFLFSACSRTKTVCLAGDEAHQDTLTLADLIDQPPPVQESPIPIEVEIQGKLVAVDKVVDYPFCNDDWSGIVYISCDARVAEAVLDADENPLFLKGCDLNIAPQTVVYVAAHNDAAYYKGCSCHTGEATLP